MGYVLRALHEREGDEVRAQRKDRSQVRLVVGRDGGQREQRVGQVDACDTRFACGFSVRLKSVNENAARRGAPFSPASLAVPPDARESRAVKRVAAVSTTTPSN